MSGTVRDGTTHDWPVYASVTLSDGGSPTTVWTDPWTGAWSARVAPDTTYATTVDPFYGGYATRRLSLSVAADPVVKDVTVLPDSSCTAPGFTLDGTACAVLPGALLAGFVTDVNTGRPVDAAQVNEAETSDPPTPSVATPDDPSIPDGLYWHFTSTTGRTYLAVSAVGYALTNVGADTAPGTVARADVALPAPRLEPVTPSLSVDLALGESTTRTVTVRNTGSAQGVVTFTRRTGPVTLLNPVTPAWTTLRPYPTPISGSVVAESGGNVYSLTGNDGTGPTGTGYVLTPGSGRWTRLPGHAAYTFDAAAGAYLDGAVQLSGDSGSPNTRDTAAYQPSYHAWLVRTSPVKKARTHAASAVDNDMLFLVGGCFGDSCGTTLVQYLSSSGSELGQPYPRAISSLACGGLEQLVCAGGLDASTGRSTSAAYAFDLDRGRWHPVSPLPLPLWGAQYAVANGRLVVAGGQITDASGTRVSDQTFVYDLQTDTWSMLPPMPRATYGGAAGCGVTSVGGFDAAGERVRATQSLSGMDSCGLAWLQLRTGPDNGRLLQVGESAIITVAIKADQVSAPGDYVAQIGLMNQTPYLVSPITVTMHVRAPAPPSPGQAPEASSKEGTS
ncbi:MAG: kelch repeat-containing protein [Lapillicoccus sp.]